MNRLRKIIKMDKIDKRATDAMVDLALEFHMRTGADLDEVKKFIRQVIEINMKFTTDVIREELSKMGKR